MSSSKVSHARTVTLSVAPSSLSATCARAPTAQCQRQWSCLTRLGHRRTSCRFSFFFLGRRRMEHATSFFSLCHRCTEGSHTNFPSSLSPSPVSFLSHWEFCFGKMKLSSPLPIRSQSSQQLDFPFFFVFSLTSGCYTINLPRSSA